MPDSVPKRIFGKGQQQKHEKLPSKQRKSDFLSSVDFSTFFLKKGQQQKHEKLHSKQRKSDFLSSVDFSKINIFKKPFQEYNTIRVSNSLDPDQALLLYPDMIWMSGQVTFVILLLHMFFGYISEEYCNYWGKGVKILCEITYSDIESIECHTPESTLPNNIYSNTPRL